MIDCGRQIASWIRYWSYNQLVMPSARAVRKRRACPWTASNRRSQGPVATLYFALHCLHGIAGNGVRDGQQDIACGRHKDGLFDLLGHGAPCRSRGPRHRPSRRIWFRRWKRAFSSRVDSSHWARSWRCQPIACPRNRCGYGNRPTAVSAKSSHRWRRVRRATSCALRSRFSGGKGSFTRLERRTFAGNLAGGTIVRRTESVVLMGLDAHVRFRSFRDESSLTANDPPRRQESQPRFSAKTRKNSGGPYHGTA